MNGNDWQRRINANAGCGLSRRRSSRLRAILHSVGCCAFARECSMSFACVRTLEHSLFDVERDPDPALRLTNDIFAKAQRYFRGDSVYRVPRLAWLGSWLVHWVVG
jgi:hypothetical protein